MAKVSPLFTQATHIMMQYLGGELTEDEFHQAFEGIVALQAVEDMRPTIEAQFLRERWNWGRERQQ